MKKYIAIILTIALMVTLTGCLGDGTVKLPDKMSDGASWDPAWTGLGDQIGVEQPGHDFVLLTTNGSLEGAEIYYATWIGGKETKLDKDTFVYESQLYLMAEPCGLTSEAEDTLALWKEQLGGDFAVTEETTITAAGVEYTLYFYECLTEDSHYTQGVMALGVHSANAIVVDLAKVDGYNLELGEFLEEFLSGFHFA